MLRIQVNATRRDIGLSDAKHTPIRTARLEAGAAKKLAVARIDPLEEGRKVTGVIPTFEQAAKSVHAEMIKSWKNGKHTKQWLKTLELYAYPKLGKVKVNKSDGPLVRDALAGILARGSRDRAPGTTKNRHRAGLVLFQRPSRDRGADAVDLEGAAATIEKEGALRGTTASQGRAVPRRAQGEGRLREHSRARSGDPDGCALG